MKAPRPTLREIVRPPAVSDFIDRGVVPESTAEAPPPEDGRLLLGIPVELSEALRLKMEERGLDLDDAVREMVLDFLMKYG